VSGVASDAALEAEFPEVVARLRASAAELLAVPPLDGDELWCRIVEHAAAVPEMPHDRLIPWLVEHSDTRIDFPDDFDPEVLRDDC
jgi:hypothetical protein